MLANSFDVSSSNMLKIRRVWSPTNESQTVLYYYK